MVLRVSKEAYFLVNDVIKSFCYNFSEINRFKLTFMRHDLKIYSLKKITVAYT